VEIEAKYTAPDTTVFASLQALKALGPYALRPKEDRRLVDHYLDTAERDLFRNGYACRLREAEAGSAWVATIKGLGRAEGATAGPLSLHQREEHEVEVQPHSAPDDWPESTARELALRLSAGRPLLELFSLRQTRSRRAVKQGRRTVGELSLDVVEIEIGDQKTIIHELEIELTKTGTLTDLTVLADSLRGYALTPQPQSKFERALALLNGQRPPDDPDTVVILSEAKNPGIATPRPFAQNAQGDRAKSLRETPADRRNTERPKKKHPGVRADEPMAEAGRKILRLHFERMTANEDGAREGTDIEALHDMRVATRRQRAAVRIVAPYFKRKAIRSFQDELRTLARHLGAVRDLDVLIEAAQSFQSSLNKEAAEAFQPLLDEWNRQRNFARETLLNYLNSGEYRAFTEKYETFLSQAGAGVKETVAPESPKPALVRHILPTEIWTHYGNLRAYETVLDWASLETIHALRIEGKRLRYLLEFFAEALDPAAGEAIEMMVALQDHIGELHDTDVTINLLREFLMQGAQSPLKPEMIAAVTQYLKLKQNRLRTLQRTLKRPWRRVNGARFRKLLARAAAVL